jgi:hypothetical protein
MTPSVGLRAAQCGYTNLNRQRGNAELLEALHDGGTASLIVDAHLDSVLTLVQVQEYHAVVSRHQTS